MQIEARVWAVLCEADSVIAACKLAADVAAFEATLRGKLGQDGKQSSPPTPQGADTALPLPGIFTFLLCTMALGLLHGSSVNRLGTSRELLPMICNNTLHSRVGWSQWLSASVTLYIPAAALSTVNAKVATTNNPKHVEQDHNHVKFCCRAVAGKGRGTQESQQARSGKRGSERQSACNSCARKALGGGSLGRVFAAGSGRSAAAELQPVRACVLPERFRCVAQTPDLKVRS